ncbi:MAG: hypothetical protein Q9209_005096 [Squamulea sp. 1 TL-2023]
MVFAGQHPQWPKEKKVLGKSNLELLTASSPSPPATAEEEATSAEGEDNHDATCGKLNKTDDMKRKTTTKGKGDFPIHPIPIFVQQEQDHRSPSFDSSRHARFTFSGYYRIASIRYLEPRSMELMEMMELKYNLWGKKRSVEAWERSLGERWAVVEFVSAGEEAIGNPMVPLRGRDRGEGKGVREMLEEMRLDRVDDLLL